MRLFIFNFLFFSMFSLCVYCGSRSGKNPAFEQAAQAVGHWLGEHQAQLVYGGGSSGLMNTVADATLAAGGRVVGVITPQLAQIEIAKTACTELLMAQDMHARKALMAKRADAFLILPGGIGTFEEFFETWTWKQLGYHNKPIGILNVDHYYDSLLNFLQNCVQEGLMNEAQSALIHVDHTVPAVLTHLMSVYSSSSANPKFTR
jgi:uncharacterized protein (TIGR00730 family)